MKKLWWALGALVLFFASLGTAAAVPILGSITATPTGGMFATAGWADNPDALLTWSVDSADVNGNIVWTYDYQFTVGRKELSHILFQVSNTFTTANILDGTTQGWDLGTFGSAGNSSPGIPQDLYAMYFDGTSISDSFTIVTDRAPMWGSFYAKDGKDGGLDVYAYNTSFGLASDADIFGAAPQGFVLVPDTQTGIPFQVPEPGNLALAGIGLAALSFTRRRKATP